MKHKGIIWSVLFVFAAASPALAMQDVTMGGGDTGSTGSGDFTASYDVFAGMTANDDPIFSDGSLRAKGDVTIFGVAITVAHVEWSVDNDAADDFHANFTKIFFNIDLSDATETDDVTYELPISVAGVGAGAGVDVFGISVDVSVSLEVVVTPFISLKNLPGVGDAGSSIGGGISVAIVGTATASVSIAIVEFGITATVELLKNTLEGTFSGSACEVEGAIDYIFEPITISIDLFAQVCVDVWVGEVCIGGSVNIFNFTAGEFTVPLFSITKNVDRTDPTLTVSVSVTKEQTSASGAAHSFSSSSTDLCDPSPAITDNAPSVYPLGTTTVTFTATDGADTDNTASYGDGPGNSTSTTRTVTVQDSKKPILTVPANKTVEQATAAGTIVPLSASATDICDTSVTITSNGLAIYPLGTTTVTFTATDDTGNSTSGSMTVTVVDTTDPILTVPANKSVEQATAAGTVVALSASATDICDASVLITSNELAIYPLGTTTVTFTATDDASNSTSGSMTVTVVDTTAPSAISITNPAEMECLGASPTVTTTTPTDICDAAPVVNIVPAGPYAHGDHLVTVSATDASGNTGPSATVNFTVDTVAPSAEFTHPVDGGAVCWPAEVPITVTWTSDDDDGALGDVVATSVFFDSILIDSGDGTLLSTIIDVASICDLGINLLGEHTLEVTVEDCGGNTTTAVSNFQVDICDDDAMTVKPGSLNSNNGKMTVFFIMPDELCAEDPVDLTAVDKADFKLTADDLVPGPDDPVTITATKVNVDLTENKLIIKFVRSDFGGDPIGINFSLVGLVDGVVIKGSDTIVKNP